MDYQKVNSKCVDSWCEAGWIWGQPITHEEYEKARNPSKPPTYPTYFRLVLYYYVLNKHSPAHLSHLCMDRKKRRHLMAEAA